MVAAINLKAGDIILSEVPTVLGSQIDGPLRCFNCLKNIRRRIIITCKICSVAVLCNSQCTGEETVIKKCIIHLKRNFRKISWHRRMRFFEKAEAQ